MKARVTATLVFLITVFWAGCGGDDSNLTGEDAGTQRDAEMGDVGSSVGGLGDPCMNKEDCAEGLICAGGVCAEKQCETDADCGDANKECKDYQCADKQADTSCSLDEECTGAKERCIDNLCTGVECVSDGDCGADRVCEKATWTCKDKEVGPECTVDSDCDDGFKCDNQKCVDDGKCKTDADCAVTPNTPKCDTNSGECVQCLVDGDCGGDLICKNKVCVTDTEPPQDKCASDEECCEIEGGSVCLASGCQKTGSTAEQCDASNTCPSGKTPVQEQDQQGNQVCLCLIQCTLPPSVCTTSSDCTDPQYPVCDSVDTGQCVQCLGDLDCTNGKRCNSATKTCEGETPPTGCATDEECCALTSGSFCLATGCQNTGSTAEQCDTSGACANGKSPVQAQDQQGNQVCICLVTCTGPTPSCNQMCCACTSDADCGVDQSTGMQLVCTTVLTGQVCGTGDMITDLMACVMGGGTTPFP